MFGHVFNKVFGSQADRTFKKFLPTLGEIKRFESELGKLDEAQLQHKTLEFKELLAARIGPRTAQAQELASKLRGDLDTVARDELNSQFDAVHQEIRDLEAAALDELMPQAFAVVRETCRRLIGREWDVTGSQSSWDMVPYDVQMFGGTVLHEGKIAEMATGEGKTLVATMPLYLNALTGRGVHLITHNNYLAKRDAMWMGPLYNYLGLAVGIIQDAHQTGGSEAFHLPRPDGVPTEFQWRETSWKEAYGADVVYATKDQIGFHYLYDNMASRREEIMQREFNYAIVDEADSNLIDDARTPLIISGPVRESSNRYGELKPMVDKLIRAQSSLVSKIIAEAEKKRAQDENGDDYDVGVALLKAARGAPKNRRFMKIQQEEGIKRLIAKVEADYMRDKRLSDIDEALYYAVDEKSHTIDLTDQGRDLLSPDEQAVFILPDISFEVDAIQKDESLDSEQKSLAEEEAYRNHASKSEAVHNINQLMRAYTLFEKDVQYMVSEDGRVVIVDESTGRPQPGRRFSDGLHQALEAKEGVKIQQETQTIATITLQNLFRMYHRLAGMTGTAETEAGELWQIYKLDVVVVPTNRPVRRVDQEDLIFRTKREKYNALIDEIARLHEAGLPMLVGTISVEVSELLSRMLTRKGIKHQLLNARYHEKEAQIVAQAGQAGAVTIATNMAGRGTDIKLTPTVIKIERELLNSGMTLDDKLPGGEILGQHLLNEPSGLQVIGTERHEARRIDRQLRGRAARQGDPGSSRFFLSLEDDLMRLFGSERIAAVMDRLGAEEGEVIEHSMVTKSIQRAQKKVEARNFEIRKHLLDYDDVMNQQRQVIYNRRHDVLERETAAEQVMEMIAESIDTLLIAHIDTESHPSEWNWDGLQSDFGNTFFMGFASSPQERESMTLEKLSELMQTTVEGSYRRRIELVGDETFHEVEKAIVLHTIDTCWQDHLYEMDELKEGVGFVGVAGKNPLIEYKKGAYDLFESLIARINEETLRHLFQLRVDVDMPDVLPQHGSSGRYSSLHREATNLGFDGASPEGRTAPPTMEGVTAGSHGRESMVASGGGAGEAPSKQPKRVGPKVGRNEPCPCGSGRKFKRCCGARG
jgi:preprotein translocase subunit SecA